MSLSAWLNAAAARALVLEEGGPSSVGMVPTVPAGAWRRAGGEGSSIKCPDGSTSPNLLKIDHQAGKLRTRL